MLSPTIDLPSDEALGSFAACLDATIVLAICRKQLTCFDDTLRGSWVEARKMEALYHPGRHLRVVYALLSDPDMSADRYWPEAQIVYFHWPVRPPMSRRGVVVSLGDAEVEAYCFPNDRRLRGLRCSTHRDTMIDAWQCWTTNDSKTLDGNSLQRLLVRYVPEQKWVVRLRGEFRLPDGSESEKRRIALRISSPSTCHMLAERHTRMASTNNSDAPCFTIPQVVGQNFDKGMLAVEWIRGAHADEALRSHPSQDILNETAVRLRAFHATPCPGLAMLSSENLIHRMNHAIEDLSTACPDTKPLLSQLSEAFRDDIDRPTSCTSVTLHNDFHWKQLAIKGNRFVLFDLDRMARGDALLDVVNFATQLQMLGYRSDLSVDVETAQAWRQSFLNHWADMQTQPVDELRSRCYATLSRLELARGMMRHLRPGWMELAHRCVDLSFHDYSSSSNSELGGATA